MWLRIHCQQYNKWYMYQTLWNEITYQNSTHKVVTGAETCKVQISHTGYYPQWLKRETVTNHMVNIIAFSQGFRVGMCMPVAGSCTHQICHDNTCIWNRSLWSFSPTLYEDYNRSHATLTGWHSSINQYWDRDCHNKISDSTECALEVICIKATKVAIISNNTPFEG